MRKEPVSKMRENIEQKEFVTTFLRQFLLTYQFVFSFPNVFVPDLLFVT